MDFALSEEQEMLKAQARSFLETKCPPESVVRFGDAQESWDRTSWHEMAELGWMALSIDEELGGAGGSFVDEAVLLEELARALYPGPFLSTVVMCLPALAGTPELLAQAVSGEKTYTFAWAEPSGVLSMAEVDGCGTKAEQDNGTWRLTGEKFLVPDIPTADRIIVAASTATGVGLFAVDGMGEPSSTVDLTRPLGTIRLSETQASPVVDAAGAAETIDRIRTRALAALAVEAVGVAQKVLELAVDYGKTRRQFDKPIGAYQAVSHQIADTYMEVELARSLAYWAAWCVAENDAMAAVAAPSAKAFCGEAAVRACERSIQVHGGVGFTWEHMLHRYYRRAQGIDSFEGHGSVHREHVARRLLDPRSGFFSSVTALNAAVEEKNGK
jgi:alkylation response protein AidB-like acyl-CoA dehydrogenase